MLPAWRCVQTFLTAHELSLCLHSSAAVFGKCHLKLSAFDGIDEYSLIYSAFYQLLNALLVNRTDAVFHLVPVFTGAVKRILSSQTCHVCIYFVSADCRACVLLPAVTAQTLHVVFILCDGLVSHCINTDIHRVQAVI